MVAMAAMGMLCGYAQGGAKNDSVRYAVQKTSPTNEKDLERKVADLRNPENLTTETSYDEKNHMYIVGNKIGDSYLSVPLLMSPEEYAEWSMKRSLDAYFRAKNQEEFEKEGKKEKFDFTDMKFDLGPAEKIFGPGGVQIKTQGSAELKLASTRRASTTPRCPCAAATPSALTSTRRSTSASTVRWATRLTST